MSTTDEKRCGTSTDLARRIGVSVATVSRLASGNRSPSVALMERISKVIEWPIEKQCRAYLDGTYGQKLTAAMEQWHPTPEELLDKPVRNARRRRAG